ncbi:uncharacterized protein LOC131021399 [Salvia miltiorrhiza]|uniref:uncharacterized protein LOC131021399 n=1 Tax=Salvia miltiorrhiza TaxID=226208 RepID=UPI0025ABBFF6|nr:uncharacterized protein LOC131021399 [Salvia miltiorrhiza]
MKLSEILDQTYFFYDLKWNATMDAKLLDIMLAHKDECFMAPVHKSPHVHIEALTTLNNLGKPDKELHLMDVEDRAEFLHGRFLCFKTIMNTPGAHWDQHTNCIIAAEKVWLKMIKDNNFAQAYYYSGEPEHRKMFNLFGSDEIKTELSHTVILISDTVPEQGKTIDLTQEVSSDDDVTSPSLVNVRKMRKKLTFGDNDAESTALGYETSPSRCECQCPQNNTPPTKGKNVEAGGSSCASCSPFK